MQLIECPALLEYLENDPRSVLCLDIETDVYKRQMSHPLLGKELIEL